MDGKWKVRDNKETFDGEWCHLDVVNVELPDGTQIDHPLVRQDNDTSVNVVAFDPEKGILLLWRHRFITDTWGWELPCGGVDDKELPVKAAERELLEETGWRAGKLQRFHEFHPMPGLTTQTVESYFTEGATFVGPGRDTNEAYDIAWTPIDQVKTIIEKREITDGFTLTTLMYALNFGPLSGK